MAIAANCVFALHNPFAIKLPLLKYEVFKSKPILRWKKNPPKFVDFNFYKCPKLTSSFKKKTKEQVLVLAVPFTCYETSSSSSVKWS